VTAGEIYGPFLAAQLAEQRSRKASLEQRGLAVVTTSGTLAALLAGFGVLAGAQPHHVARLVAVAVTLGGASFVAAAGLGLWVNRPCDYHEPEDEWLEKLTAESVWNGDENQGSRRVAECNVGTLVRHRKVNGRKASQLAWAVVFEVVATVFLAVGIGLIICGFGQSAAPTYALTS
jgi:hypothetical protein